MIYVLHHFKPLNIAYVRNAKVASTRIQGMLEKELAGKLVHPGGGECCDTVRLKADQTNEFARNNNVFLFTFVRNPYERAVSLYYDKLNRVVAQFDKRTRLQYKLREILAGPRAWRNHRFKCEIARNYVSFEQFLAYLELNGIDFDPHFGQQSRGIGFGKIQYDFIGKIEDFRAGMAHVFHQAGYKDSAAIQELCGRRTNHSTYENPIQGLLSAENKKIIYKLYQPDFSAFDYEI